MTEQERSTPVASDSATDDQVLLEWTTHPMKRRPLVAALVTLFITLCSVLAWYATDMMWFGILALIVLCASLTKFYLPTTFRLSEKTVSIRGATTTMKREWKQFRSFYPDKNGVLLSPFVEPSRLENFRGMYLIFNDNRDQVVNVVKSRIAAQPDGAGAAS